MSDYEAISRLTEIVRMQTELLQDTFLLLFEHLSVDEPEAKKLIGKASEIEQKRMEIET